MNPRQPPEFYLRSDYTARGQLAATGWDDEGNNWWSKVAAYTYLPDGKVDHQDYGNGTRSGFAYDGRGMTEIVDHYRLSPHQDYSWRKYWRDDRDRIKAFQKGGSSLNPLENGRGDRFRYDEEGQLVEGWYNAANPAASGDGATRYEGFNYDAMGNRQFLNYLGRWGPTSFARRDNGLNQYLNWSGTPINYEANGDTLQEGWIDATYNALNQPISISSPISGGKMWFGYDPLGRCVKRWVGESGDVYSNPATYLHYDGWNLLQEGTSAWGPARVYVHGNRVDEIVWSYNTFTGEQAFHHYDARGHCTLLTDSLGGILEQYEYDAFGQPYIFDSIAQPLNSSAVGNRFLFTGREWLQDLWIYDFRNRMYHPELGRFLQPDPKQFEAGDYNLYRYCHNDPINNSDPMGLAMFGLYDSYGDYFADVGQVFIGEAKGAANILSLGFYQPSYPNINQQFGGYVGQGLAVVGLAAATKAGPKPAAVGTNVRPRGIPENWTSSATRTEGGTIYRNPAKPNETVRVMPGNPESPYPNSQNPYVRQTDSSGKFLDANGKPGGKNTEETHIPLDKFRFRQ